MPVISAPWNLRWYNVDQSYLRSVSPEIKVAWDRRCLRYVWPEISAAWNHRWLSPELIRCLKQVLPDISVGWVLTVVGASWSQDCPWSVLPESYNLVPFPALFLIYFSTFTVQYFTRFTLVKFSSLGWFFLGSSCAEKIICAGLPAEVFPKEGCRAVESNPGLPSSTLSTKPRCTLCQTTLHPNKPRSTPECIGCLRVVWMSSILISYYLV